MGKKRIFSKLLLFAAMVSTIGAGVLSSVPLPVKAAEEEEIYTVRFEAYEGTCGTESVSVPKGKSIILPDAVYEGHYLDGWVDAVDEGNMTTFRTIGVTGSEYTPERDLWLYANWKSVEEQDITVIYAYGSATAYQVMAVVKYSIDDLEEWDFRTRNHADMESYNAWMEQLQGRALYYEEADYAPTCIITLATCDRRVHGKNGRFLVIAGK